MGPLIRVVQLPPQYSFDEIQFKLNDYGNLNGYFIVTNDFTKLPNFMNVMGKKQGTGEPYYYYFLIA